MAIRLAEMPETGAFMQKGDSFLFATQVLEGQMTGRSVAAFALVVNSAFSSEVYLKVLTIIERQLKPLKTHNLENLFKDISPETQSVIRNTWEKDFPPGLQKDYSHIDLPKVLSQPHSFDDALRKSASAFVDFRYGGFSGKPRYFHMLALPTLLRAQIQRQRPELIKTPRVTVHPANPPQPDNGKSAPIFKPAPTSKGRAKD